MENTQLVISEIIDRPDFMTQFFGDLQQMATDYENQILMQQFAEELNN
jgi:hypothetical protein